MLSVSALVCCGTVKKPVQQPLKNEPPSIGQEIEIKGEPVKLWATFYYSKALKAYSGNDGIPIRDMRDQVIGPKLKPSEWCKASIEGTFSLQGETYNFAGTKWPRQTRCSHKPSEKVRWKKSKFKYGYGNKGNALVPFKSIACDQGTVKDSKPIPGIGFLKFGTKIYIPKARGVALPDGSIHDGIFICDDVGGAITGNHIDIFLGLIEGGLSSALKINPFNFIKSRESGTFGAVVIE